MQLTTDTYETAASRLSDVIELSEGNEDEQTSESLNIVADYAAELAMFVDESEVIINNTVSSKLSCFSSVKECCSVRTSYV